jgi:hypothetical protein
LLKFRRDRQSWVQWLYEALKENRHSREEAWTEGIAVGSRDFVERTKETLGVRANGRKLQTSGVAYELREPQLFYEHAFDSENQGLSEENTYFWGNYAEISDE